MARISQQNPQAAAMLREIFSNDHERGKVSIKTEKYVRTRFTIDAVQVTPENFAQVAEWCNGKIMTDMTTPEHREFIKVEVHHPLSERQTKAYVNDWVLFAGKGFKCYTPKAFARTFEKVFQPKEQSVGNAVVTEEIIPGITASRVEPVYTHEEIPEGTAADWDPTGKDDEQVHVISQAKIIGASLVPGPPDPSKSIGSVEIIPEAGAVVEPAYLKEKVYVTEEEFQTLGDANMLSEDKDYVIETEAEKIVREKNI